MKSEPGPMTIWSAASIRSMASGGGPASLGTIDTVRMLADPRHGHLARHLSAVGLRLEGHPLDGGRQDVAHRTEELRRSAHARDQVTRGLDQAGQNEIAERMARQLAFVEPVLEGQRQGGVLAPPGRPGICAGRRGRPR